MGWGYGLGLGLGLGYFNAPPMHPPIHSLTYDTLKSPHCPCPPHAPPSQEQQSRATEMALALEADRGGGAAHAGVGES